MALRKRPSSLHDRYHKTVTDSSSALDLFDTAARRLEAVAAEQVAIADEAAAQRDELHRLASDAGDNAALAGDKAARLRSIFGL